MRLWSIIAVLLLAACGRSPGPHEDEFGQVTFWLVHASESEQVGCTDLPEFQEWFQESLVFTRGTAWYYIYRVSPDGTRAVGQSCDPWDWSRCEPRPWMILSIEDHVLTYDHPPERLENLGGCGLDARISWRLEDQGKRMVGEHVTTFELVGNPDACESYDQSVRERSFNGQGVAGCRSVMRTEASFSHTRD